MPEMLKELAFTQEEIDELNRSREIPITFDEDCPETTPERAVRFYRVNPLNKTEKGTDKMCEADSVPAKRAEEAVMKNWYETARLLWENGEHDYDKISRMARLTLEEVREAFGEHSAFMEPDAKLAFYAHLAQAENDLKHGRVQNMDDALNEILSELNGLECF